MPPSSCATRRARAALAELVAWLPDLTAEAHEDPILPRGRRTLPAAGAWLADAALSPDDHRDAAVVRARAAQLARARLASYAAHGCAEPLTESVQRCARALARALEPPRGPAERRDMIVAVHGELLALAVLRTHRTPPPPETTPLTSHPGWTTRAAALAVLQCADATTPRYGALIARDAVAEQVHAAGSIGLTGIVGALPALALDAIWLDVDGAGLDARAARARLDRASARAAAALFHAYCALEQARVATTRRHAAITETGRLRLVEIATADGERSPMLEGIDRCAQSLADALTAGPADEVTPSLWILAGELAALVALTNACQRSGAPARHTTPPSRATRPRSRHRRR